MFLKKLDKISFCEQVKLLQCRFYSLEKIINKTRPTSANRPTKKLQRQLFKEILTLACIVYSDENAFERSSV